MSETDHVEADQPANGFLSTPAGRILNGLRLGLYYDEIPMRSAALAYQFIFSLFPLLLFAIFLGTRFLSTEEVRLALEELLLVTVPTEEARVFITDIVDQTIANSTSLGVLATLGLLWTASSVVNSVQVSINVIWGVPWRAAWRRRLISLGVVVVAGTLLVSSIVLSALPLLALVDQFETVSGTLNTGFRLMVEILFFLVVYWGVPNTKVALRAALPGAVLAGGLWELAQIGFRFYLTSGFSTLGAVYGTLATVLGLVLWAFLTGFILYLGAEVAANLQRELWPEVHGGR